MNKYQTMDKNSERLYNNVCVCEEQENQMNVGNESNTRNMILRLSKEQGEKILGKYRKHIKKTIKSKIDIYKPLDFKTTFNGFLQWARADHCKAIREMPEDRTEESFLDELIKNYLIENAYYALEETYIKRRIMNKLGVLNANDIRFMEIIDFIIERIERERMKKLKTFGEKAGFKTFLTTVVTRLLYDFWRGKAGIQKNVTKYETDFEDLFDKPQKSPLETLIHQDDRQTQQAAAEVLPGVMAQLSRDQRLAIKLKYEQNMRISAIARTLGHTRYKTEEFLKQIESKISKEIVSKIIQGGKNGAYRR
ncbi:MAG: sigma-70 family RNA polymerase sigma factor [bacterium]|nr:sigma-70 family RNA polymerase sigma factor [bacterium]